MNRLANRGARFAPAAYCTLALTVAGLALAAPARAQDRLLGLRAFTGGAVFDQVSFGDGGMLQGALPGQDSLRLLRVSQFSIPVGAAIPLGASWTFDVSGSYASGEVETESPDGSASRTYALQGISDVRVRLTGRLLNDGLVFTLGGNAPTGATELDGEQLTALRSLAAPGLALGAAPVGTGPSGTVGLLFAREVGASWAIAVGGSYEYRGTFQPVAALVAGAPSTDFTPGGVIRATAGADGFVGRNRLSLSVSGDFFLEDELNNPAAANASGDALARVQLGPILGLDAQLQIAAPRLRELVLWSSLRARSAFSRDGVTIDGTDATYFDGGMRLALPVGRRTDLFATVDGRLHSGFEIDEGLPTAAVTSLGGTIGLSRKLTSTVSMQPFARAQIGTVTAGGTAADRPEASMTGFGGGLVIVTRF